MNLKRARIIVKGAVQGVGFRPFVYRLARELQLAGWVSNSSQGVEIDAEGLPAGLDEFLARLEREKPGLAVIQSVDREFLAPQFCENFEIHESNATGARTALILPDIATCPDCLRECLDPNDRRYLYPFTNCTHCGPRFSIIEALPYDRANTSMKKFALCAECEREYHDPENRRFHAQPNACPKCGPHLELWDAEGRCLQTENDALMQAANAIRRGGIVAIKGIGGFQLFADAGSEETIQRLRARKHREAKPFALMFPSPESIRENCEVLKEETELLLSPASPIVLLKKSDGAGLKPFAIAPSVAPSNPYLGAMLPYSPLHHLLLRAVGIPLVATSGNLTDEPICTDEREALEQLRGIADFFLVHDRPIVRHVDDSVTMLMGGREMIVRRARGYAPMPLFFNEQRSQVAETKREKTILALGAHLKNAVALGVEKQVFVSQHIGDLETAQAYSAFRKSAADLPRLYDASPEIIAHDLHPDYLSTKFARRPGSLNCENSRTPELVGIQHHYAHVLSCMIDNELDAPALGVSWDGTGFGIDGTIWGGEFLLVNKTSFERFAHFRQFRLAGGDAAIKQPRRTAVGVLFEIFGPAAFERTDLASLRDSPSTERRMLHRMLTGKINSPITSSAGRLFDAVASIIGLRQRANFEGQAAMELEFAATPGIEDAYPFELRSRAPIVFDWEPLILELLQDLSHDSPAGIIAAKFHNTLAMVIVSTAQAAGEKNVALSGGCFQNRYLTERAIRLLRESGFVPYWHRRVPPNDGGVALGQVAAAVRGKTRVGFKPDGRTGQIVPQLVAAALK